MLLPCSLDGGSVVSLGALRGLRRWRARRLLVEMMRSTSTAGIQAGWGPLADLQFAVACVLVVVVLVALALLLAARAPVFFALILVLPAAAALGGTTSGALGCGSHLGA